MVHSASALWDKVVFMGSEIIGAGIRPTWNRIYSTGLISPTSKASRWQKMVPCSSLGSTAFQIRVHADKTLSSANPGATENPREGQTR
jgi:hypothetical protein